MTKELKVLYKYLKYIVLSKTRYGIHSPFVYNFVKEVMHNNLNFSEYKTVDKLRKSILSDKRLININDLGAGSRVSNFNHKTVSNIYNRSALRKKYAQLLFRIVRTYQISNILELGTSLGLTTIYFSLANPDSKVYTIEGSEDIFDIANENFKLIGLKNINSILGSFNDNIDSVLEEIESLDLVFFDGDHTYESTINYFEKCLAKSHKKSIFIFDDIKWSKEMENAWDYIKNKQEVSATIDIFFMGFVFFDNSLSKQNFVIRF